MFDENHKNENDVSILLLLFWSFFKISLFVIGGGLAMIPVIRNVFVHKYKLLTEDDIVDMIAVTQTIPGLIAVNSSIFVGNKLAGIKGAMVSTIAVLIPSLLILGIIAAFFPLQMLTNSHLLAAFSGIRACVAGIFLGMFIQFAQKTLKSFLDGGIVLFLIGLLLAGAHVVIIILISIILGMAILFRDQLKEGTYG